MTARRSRLIATSICLVLPSLIVMSACAANKPVSTGAPMPPISEMDAAMEAPAPEPMAADAAPAPALTPVGIVESSAAVALAPPGASNDQRIEALEKAVQGLKDDYDRMAPAFSSLNTTNARIEALLTKMEGGQPVTVTTTTKTQTPPPAPLAPVTPPDILPPAKIITPADAPDLSGARILENTPSEQVPVTRTVSQTKLDTPAPARTPLTPPVLASETSTTVTTEPASAPVTTKSAAAASAMSGSVTGLRIGEHGNKTRLVFDMTANAKPEFKYDIDNAENLLLVEMPTQVWTGAAAGKPNSPIISSWNAQSTASGGARVAIQLKKDARVLSTEFLKAEGKDPARMVLDIAAGA